MMRYPKLKCEDKQNTKVCSITIQKMKAMRKEKYSYQQIADKFEVSKNTVGNYVSPVRNTQEQLEKSKKRSREYNNQRYNNDPEFRQKMLDASARHRKEKWNNDPKFKKWSQERTAINTKKAHKKHPTWSYTCARDVHENTISISRCKNIRGNCKCPCHKK